MMKVTFSLSLNETGSDFVFVVILSCQFLLNVKSFLG